MTAIDDRAAQLDQQGKSLGQELGAEKIWRVKAKPFENAILADFGPGVGVYTLAEATVADKFLDSPA